MRVDVSIVGGGLAGAALAVALRRADLSVALIESRAPVRPNGWDDRIYAISPANARFLDAIGIWNHLDRSRIQAVEKMDIHGDGNGHIEFSAYDSGVDELAWICESSLLHCELWESIKRQANVRLLCPARPATLFIGPEGVTLGLEDGRVLASSLIVGADGADSWVRTRAGITTRWRPYEQLGVVANFATERTHGNTASQWFNGKDVLAWLPLPGKQISMVWSTPNATAHELMALNDSEFERRVAEAGGFQLGRMTLLARPQAFPLRLMRVVRTAQPKLALIGDAAHAIHPLSGHGINLGLQDAAVLAGILLNKAGHADCGSLPLLRTYERARKEDVLALQAVTDTLHRLFSAQADPLLPWASLRNAGMNVTNHLPVLKDRLVRYALAS